MKQLLCLWALLAALCALPANAATAKSPDTVTVSEGVVTMPTYESPGRDLNPPLFSNSSQIGLYPFTTYEMPFKPGGPVSQKYPAVFVENEYLKLTYIPEFGGRFFSLYDKLRHRPVLYHNDVIKPADYNKRDNFPLFGIELTGPFDAHSRTLHSEPYWSHTVVRHKDGSVSVVLGETDPVYHMDVTFTATLYPGVAAMKTSVFCYNPNDAQKPQMFWTSAALHSTPKTRFLYPMTRTVGHTTGEVASWPEYNGVDYSWDRNNHNMLGVFGIDTYDNYGGAYKFDKNYGVFRYADRRVVQGMKLWTFGYSPLATVVMNAYTDHAGPYIEIQSGRMLWDGYYEYVFPHKTETWHEWWIPVAGIDGLTSLAPDAALNLEVHPDPAGKNSSVLVALSPVRTVHNARLLVKAKSGELLNTSVNLVPGNPIKKEIQPIATDASGLTEMEVLVTAPDGSVLLDYHRPDSNPGGKDSPYANGLASPPIPLDKMTAEEAVMAAQLKMKELDYPAAADLAKVALQRDPGYSTAHQLLGMLQFDQGRYQQAATEFQKAVDRNPYDSESWYYLAICQLRLDQAKQAENNLYYIWPGSAYYGPREYQLGRLAFLRNDRTAAEQHLLGAITANGGDLQARLLLAVLYRDEGKKAAALEQLAKVTAVDPADRVAQAERYFLTGDKSAVSDLRALMGGQGEDAIQVSIFYSGLSRWKDATAVLKLVLPPYNKDPWGISPVYYYTLAYAQKQSGDTAGAAASRKQAQAAADVVERFPYREATVAPLEDAIRDDPNDAVARFNLACLQYFLGHTQAAIEQWQAVNRIDPDNFGSRRALGLAYEQQGKTDEAIAELQKAVALKPHEMNTLDDLATTYARAGRFEEETALLRKALAADPANDHLAEGLLNAYLMEGKYQEAKSIIDDHTFAPRHRTYTVREEYRELNYGMGAVAFNKGDYAQALKLFQAALKPPVSLGVDNFELTSTPRADYYIGRTLEAMGRKEEAKQSYEHALRGIDQLTGDRDSWNSDNFYMVLSLERLGRHPQAQELSKHFSGFANTELDSTRITRRARAHYLLALVKKYNGQPEEARKLMMKAIRIEPDFLQPRYELRGDTIDPLESVHAGTEASTQQ
jgi:tetratricopeptide (TPR) repeat protein